jgi:hypothetical protein
MKKNKILKLARLISLVIIVSVLLWVFVGGGCLNFERVKLLHNNVKSDIIALCVLFFSVTFGLCATQVVFENRYIAINQRMILLSVQLLI